MPIGEGHDFLCHLGVGISECRCLSISTNNSYFLVCLMHKERVPYRRIKEYCLKVLAIQEDHVKALTRAGMACYYLREYELARFYLQNAKDASHEPVGRF